MKRIKSAFGKCAKSSACWILGTMMAVLTVLCTPGCDKIMGINDDKVKESLLEIINNSFKDNSAISGSVKAVKVRELTLAQESMGKRVGYADVVYKSVKTGKEITLKHDVKITGSVFDEKVLIETKLRDPSDGLKLLGLCGGF